MKCKSNYDFYLLAQKILGNEENAGYQHFDKPSFSGLLTHYQTTNFRLFQTKRVCRRQFQL